ncbi:UNVERIFIED_CONTAM: methyltransferase domain-containing protein [Hammondia hammondi]|eukprot:XP_008886815.1 methyltransferase domain-containing protein [Hammondia hammondi]
MAMQQHVFHTGSPACPCCNRSWDELPDFHPDAYVSLAKGESCEDKLLRVSGIVTGARKLSSRLLFVDVSWPPGTGSDDHDGRGESAKRGAQPEAMGNASWNTVTIGHDKCENEVYVSSPVSELPKGEGTKEMDRPGHSLCCTDSARPQLNSLSPNEGKLDIHATGHCQNDHPSESGLTAKTEADTCGGFKAQLLFDFAAFSGICKKCFSRRAGFENGARRIPSVELSAAQTQPIDNPQASSSTHGRDLSDDVRHASEESICQPPAAIFRSLCALLLHSGCHLCVAGNPTRTSSGHLSLFVTVVTFVKAPPTFDALNRLCNSVLEGTLPPEALVVSTRVDSQPPDCSDNMPEKSLVQQLLQATPRERKIMLKRLCRRLTDRPVERMRPPSFANEDLVTLDLTKAIRTEWPVTYHFDACRSLADATDFATRKKQAKPKASSAKETADLEEYMTYKKGPQVRWMLQQIRHIVEVQLPQHVSTPGSPRLGSKEKGIRNRCLDIGGGRGDLGFALATYFPQLHVTVLDINATSLAAARQRAVDAGISNMEFICEDFSRYELSSDTILIVGLHSCGGLADCILSRAEALGVSFLVSTCCFCKHAHLRTESLVKQLHELPDARTPTAVESEERHDLESGEHPNPEQSTTMTDRPFTVLSSPELKPRSATEKQLQQLMIIESHLPRLCRLAESSDRTVSLAAMHTVNAWRLACVDEISRQRMRSDLSGCELPQRGPLYRQLCIKAFAQEYSPKNLVLVGIVRSPVNGTGHRQG